jgi:diacylglycerol kinase (ATP)
VVAFNDVQNAVKLFTPARVMNSSSAVMKGLSFRRRLKHAKRGLAAAWHRERSFRSQIVLAAAAVCGGVIVRPEPVWWAVLALAVALVLVAEMMNSSLEALADHLHPSQHPSIKIAKDMAAGAVLLASLAAAVIGALLALSALW